MKTYEITIYNKEVRDSLQNFQSHPNFDDGWSDQRFLQVEANNLQDARKIINRRYPERSGFVIVDILELPEFF